MTKNQKLAALLVILGSDSAAELLKGLSDHELEAVTAELGKLETLSPEVQSDVLREFAGIALDAGHGVRGGLEFAQHALEKAVGQGKATHILNRVAPGAGPSALAQRIASLDATQLFNLVKLEQPQTVALVLSYLGAEKASQVLSLLPPEMRGDTLERLANLGPTSTDVIESVLAVLEQRLGQRQAAALRKTGGLKSAADVLNALDKKASESLLSAIEKRRPELGQAIRKKMFTFEDMAFLETAELQKVLREVDNRDLAAALKTAADALRNVFLSSISKRAAETVREEITFLGSLKPREIEAARDRILEIVRRLETEGEIQLDLGQGGEAKDEVFA